jgi:hypothetical protein
VAVNVGSTIVGAEESEGYQGSNVDLGYSAGDLDHELSYRAQLQDEAFEMFRRAGAKISARREDLRMQYGPALARSMRANSNVTVAKAMAERDCKGIMRSLEEAEIEKEVAVQWLRSLQSQLTAALTRAKIWQAQWDVEMRGPR